MKVFALVFLFAAANAAFTDLPSMAQPLIEQTVADFMTAMENHPIKLHTALGMSKRTVEIARAERETQTQLGAALHDQLQAAMGHIQDMLNHGQTVGQSLLDRLKEMFQNLLSVGGNVSDLAGQFLQILMETGQNWLGGLLGNILGKRDLVDALERKKFFQTLGNIGSAIGSGIANIAQNVLSNINVGSVIQSAVMGAATLALGKRDIQDPRFIEGLDIGNLMGSILGNLLGSVDLSGIPIIGDLLTGVLGNILGKRDIQDPRFIEGLDIGNLMGSILGNLLGSVDLSGIPIIGDLLTGVLGNILGKRNIQDPRIFAAIGNALSNAWQAIAGHFQNFGAWVSSMAGESLSQVQGHFQNIKELASMVIGHANEMTQQTMDQALAFFEPYHTDLGFLWTQLQSAAAGMVPGK